MFSLSVDFAQHGGSSILILWGFVGWRWHLGWISHGLGVFAAYAYKSNSGATSVALNAMIPCTGSRMADARDCNAR